MLLLLVLFFQVTNFLNLYFFILGLVWIKSNGLSLFHYKNLLVLMIIGIITIMGFSAGIITIIGMAKGK